MPKVNELYHPRSDILSLFSHRLCVDSSQKWRAEAAAFLARKGFPNKRVEQWQYTDLRVLGNVPYQMALQDNNHVCAKKLLHALPEWHDVLAFLPRIVFVNGYFSPVLSQVPPTLTLTSQHFNGGGENDFFKDTLHIGQQPFVALNTALADEEILLQVQEGVEAGQILMVSLALGGETPISFHPRYTLHIGKGACLSLVSVNTGEGRYCHNPVLNIKVENNAKLKHLTLFQEGDQGCVLETVCARIAGHGVYDSFALTLCGRLTRHEVYVLLAETGGIANVNGVQCLSSEQIGDITSVMVYGASECASRQTVRTVLSEYARGVFQGKVIVRRGAQKADGYQMSQALLLSDHAEVNVKPELEIYADNVRCSHGATVGALDEDQLFYLRSRGIPEDEAQNILIEAFLKESLSLLEDERLRRFCHAGLVRSFYSQKGASS